MEGQGPRGVPGLAVLALLSVSLAGTLYGYLYIARGAFLADDAYISFRYAKRWAEGHGLTWNDGMWVEGFSNPLWTLTLGAVDRFGPLPHVVAPWLGLAFLLLVPLALGVLASRLRLAPAATALLLLGTSLDVGLALWSSSGLETAQVALLYALWLAVAAAPLHTHAVTALLGLLTGLLLLSRPEAPLWVVVMGAWLAVREWPAWPKLVTWAGLSAAPWLGYLVFRWTHYGRLLPNTFYAKAEWSAPGLSNSIDNLTGWIIAHLVPIGLLLLAWRRPAAPSRGSRRVSLLHLGAGCLVAQAVFVLAVGGDHLGSTRFIAPVLPGFYLVVALAMSRRDGCRPPHLGTLLLVVALAAHVTIGYSTRDGFGNFVPAGRTLGLWLRNVAGPTDRLATPAAGVVPYFSGLWTYDVLGLNDPEVVQQDPRETPLWAAGHNRYDLDAMFELGPEWIVWVFPKRWSIHRMNELGIVTRRREGLDLFDALLSHPKLHERYELEPRVPPAVARHFTVFRLRELALRSRAHPDQGSGDRSAP